MVGGVWSGVKRVLLARLDNAGDVLMCGPALRTIKENLPAVHLTLLASPAGARVAGLLPWVDEVWERRVVWQDVGGRMAFDPQREWQLVAELRQRRFDAAILPTSFAQSPHPLAYACYLAGIPLRLGQSREFAGSVLNPSVSPPPDDVHQVERTLRLLESVGFVVADRHLAAHVEDRARQSLARKLRGLGLGADEPYLLLHPTTTCSARTYPVHLMAHVAALCHHRLGLPVVVSGDQKDAAVGYYVNNVAGPGTLSLVAQTSMAEFAALVERAALVLCNNTLAMHLADAFARPQVVLFSGTDLEAQWRPRRSPAVLLRRETACHPCYAFRCPFNLECLAFTPHEVTRAVEELLAHETMALARPAEA